MNKNIKKLLKTELFDGTDWYIADWLNYEIVEDENILTTVGDLSEEHAKLALALAIKQIRYDRQIKAKMMDYLQLHL